MARPSKFTVEVRRKLFGGFRSGMSIKNACEFAGISYETMKKWNQGVLPAGSRVSAQRFQEQLEDARQAGRERIRKEMAPYIYRGFEKVATKAGITWTDADEMMDKLEEYHQAQLEKVVTPLIEEATAAGIEWDGHWDLLDKVLDHRHEQRMEFLDQLWSSMEAPVKNPRNEQEILEAKLRDFLETRGLKVGEREDQEM